MAKRDNKLQTEEPSLDSSGESDDISLSEENLENSGLRDLVEKGKEKGFLTYEETNRQNLPKVFFILSYDIGFYILI